MTPTVARNDRVVEVTHDVAGDLGAHDSRVVVVESGEARAADQEVRRVDQGATEVADPHHDDVVLAVVAEGFGDPLVQDADVVAGAARAEGAESRQVTAHGRGGDAGQFADLVRVDAIQPARAPTLGDALVDRQASDGGFGEFPRSKTRGRHGRNLLGALATHLATALRRRGDGVDERRANGATLEHAQPRRGRAARRRHLGAQFLGDSPSPRAARPNLRRCRRRADARRRARDPGARRPRSAPRRPGRGRRASGRTVRSRRRCCARSRERRCPRPRGSTRPSPGPPW